MSAPARRGQKQRDAGREEDELKNRFRAKSVSKLDHSREEQSLNRAKSFRVWACIGDNVLLPELPLKFIDPRIDRFRLRRECPPAGQALKGFVCLPSVLVLLLCLSFEGAASGSAFVRPSLSVGLVLVRDIRGVLRNLNL